MGKSKAVPDARGKDKNGRRMGFYVDSEKDLLLKTSPCRGSECLRFSA